MKRLFLPIAFVIGVLTFGFGQSLDVIPTITDADIINAAVLVDPFAGKIADISPSNFSVKFINKTGVLVKASMTIEAFVTLEEDRGEPISVFNGDAKTRRPFVIPKEGRIFTSNDADNPASDLEIKGDVNPTLKKRIKDKILEKTSGGSRVPSGLYEIKIIVTVDSVGGIAVRETPIVINRSINITNPTTAVLDVPFSNGYIYPTPFPQFQWTYDTRSVKLSVYELRPEHQSLEDAIGSSAPFLQVEISRFIGKKDEPKIPTNISSFTYPQTAVNRPGVEFKGGVRQLERGKMYVVVLDGITTAFGFDVDPLRTIRSFIISDPQGQVVINILQTMFSSGDFRNMFNLIQDLNLQQNANGITLNGVALSPQEPSKTIDGKEGQHNFRTF